MSDDPQPTPVAAPKKKGGFLKVLLFAVLVLVLAGGGGAWWFMVGRAAPSAPPLESRGLITFEPFLVNLTDAGGTRFVKATIGVVVSSPVDAKKVQETPVLLMQLRSNILELLAQQSAPVLATPEGKAALKQAIKDRMSPVLAKNQVIDVLFSEFVVQF